MPHDIRHTTASGGAQASPAAAPLDDAASPYARRPQPAAAPAKPSVSAAAHARVNARIQLHVIPGRGANGAHPDPASLPDAARPPRSAARRTSRRGGLDRVLRSETTWRVVALVGTAVLAVGLTVAMLFEPAEDLYLSMRQNERLNDELQRNLDRNEQMQDRIDALQSAEGIQDEARRTLGLVLPGENAVTVTGTDYEPASSAVPAEVRRGSGTNTRSWATDLLDSVFGTESATSEEVSSEVASVTEDTAPSDDAAASESAPETA